MSSRFDQIAALDAKQQVVYRESRESGRSIDDAIAIARQSSGWQDCPIKFKMEHK
jgi:hypothetical protein